ncbi:unnamed protein product [Closterium sp. NIES-54]
MDYWSNQGSGAPDSGLSVLPCLGAAHSGLSVLPCLGAAHSGLSVLPCLGAAHSGLSVLPCLGAPDSGLSVRQTVALTRRSAAAVVLPQWPLVFLNPLASPITPTATAVQSLPPPSPLPPFIARPTGEVQRGSGAADGGLGAAVVVHAPCHDRFNPLRPD